MNNLVWLKLTACEGKNILVCANNISYMTQNQDCTGLQMVGAPDYTLYVKETLEEITKLLSPFE